MKGLTIRQRQVLDWIRDFIGANGYPPTTREIRAGFGFRSTTSVDDYLAALKRKGAIARTRRQARGIALPKPSPETPGTFTRASRCEACGAAFFGAEHPACIPEEFR